MFEVYVWNIIYQEYVFYKAFETEQEAIACQQSWRDQGFDAIRDSASH